MNLREAFVRALVRVDMIVAEDDRRALEAFDMALTEQPDATAPLSSTNSVPSVQGLLASLKLPPVAPELLSSKPGSSDSQHGTGGSIAGSQSHQTAPESAETWDAKEWMEQEFPGTPCNLVLTNILQRCYAAGRAAAPPAQVLSPADLFLVFNPDEQDSTPRDESNPTWAYWERMADRVNALRSPASTSGKVNKLSCGCLANNLSRCPIHDAP